MRLPKDILSGESTRPQCFLCQPDKTILGGVELINFAGVFKFNSFSEIIGEMDRTYIDSVTGKECVNKLYDKMEALRLLYIPTYGYFQIQEAKITYDSGREYKAIFAYSLEHELTQRYLKLFNINMGSVDSIDGVKILNQADPSKSLLHLVLDKMDGLWTVGHVDLKLQNLQRTFEVDGTAIYDFLINDLAPSINAVIEFDTFDRVVNVYEESSAGTDTDIYVSMDTLASSLQVSYSAEDIKTRLYVYGADDLTVRECNLGLEYITNLDFYATPEWMGQDLYDSYIVYCELTEKYRKQFAELMLNWSDVYDNYSNLYNQIPDYDENYDDSIPTVYAKSDLPMASEKNVYQQYRVAEGDGVWYYICKAETVNGTTTYRWVLDVDNISSFYTFPSPSIEYVGGVYKVYNEASTKGVLYYKCESYKINNNTTGYRWVLANSDYGINMLKEKEACYLDIQEVQVSAGYAEKTHEQYDRYLENYNKLIAIQKQLKEKETEAKGLQTELDTIMNQMNTISDAITLENNFTQEQIANLNPFIREDEFSNDHYVVTELDDDASALEVKKELLEAAQKELAKISQPQLSFSMDLANILAIPEFEPVLDGFETGNYIQVEIRPDYVMKTQILEVNINFDDMSDFSVTFGNLSSLYSQTDIHAALLSQAVSAGKSVAESGSYWKKGADTATSINSRIQNGLIDTLTTIKSTENQAISWDSHGLHLRKYANEGKTEYIDDQIWMNNEKIVFTDDNWKSAKMAIGKFKDPILGESYGIVAPNIVGTLIAGENLVIDSTKPDGTLSSFRVDSTGARLYNSTFLMEKEVTKPNGTVSNGQIMIDPAYGIVAGSDIYITKSDGTVTPAFVKPDGTIQKEGLFPLNSNFFLDINDGNAYFRGYVYAEDGYFSGTITSAKVESAVGNFSGSITAESGDIGGWIIKNGILYSTGTSSNEKYFVGLSSKYDYDEQTTNYAMWAGAMNPSEAPFSVTRNGNVTMKNGLIQCGIDIGNGAFTVDANSGKVKITSGEISWDIITGADELESNIADNSAAIVQLNANMNGLSTRVSDTEGNITTLKQTSTSLTSQVGSLQTGYNTIIQDLNGVAFKSDLKDGTTLIDGGCIRTGTIDADFLNLYGELTIYQNATNGVYGGTIGYYQGWSVTDGNYTATNGIGIHHNRYGQVMCTDSGVWCGYGVLSGLSAYTNGVTIKGSKIIFVGNTDTPTPTVDFTGCTVKGLTTSGGTATAVFG